MSAAVESLRAKITASVAEHDGYILKFEGTPGAFRDGLDALEAELGYQLPTDIAEFLLEFGGMRLFVDQFGLGVKILKVSEIARTNRELQKSTDLFWPKFAILGFDSTDDMLCTYRHSDGQIHFGNLHHEAWEAPDLWANEAMTFAPFQDWLIQYVRTGETIPSKDIAYAV
jgi:hypothetical protein